MKHAQYQTFTNPLGQTGRLLQAAINSQHPASVAAKIIVPFMRTPVNLLQIRRRAHAVRALVGRSAQQPDGRNGSAARDTQIAWLDLGTAVATSVVALAASTDMFPRSPGRGHRIRPKRRRCQAGWEPYSFGSAISTTAMPDGPVGDNHRHNRRSSSKRVKAGRLTTPRRRKLPGWQCSRSARTRWESSHCAGSRT